MMLVIAVICLAAGGLLVLRSAIETNRLAQADGTPWWGTPSGMTWRVAMLRGLGMGLCIFGALNLRIGYWAVAVILLVGIGPLLIARSLSKRG
jgi:hypothetical protein